MLATPSESLACNDMAGCCSPCGCFMPFFFDSNDEGDPRTHPLKDEEQKNVDVMNSFAQKVPHNFQFVTKFQLTKVFPFQIVEELS